MSIQIRNLIRVHQLFKSFIFITFLMIYDLKCQNDFFVINNAEEIIHKCVTNSTGALAWIKRPIDDNTLQQASVFIPKMAPNNFDCDIENDTKTLHQFIKNPWKLKQSHNEFIFDRRWEDMDVLVTKNSNSNEKLHYLNVKSDLKYIYTIPFSLRIEKEAHIFLCDGEDLFESNCYWISLQGKNGKRTAFQKCERGGIPTENNDKPKTSCRTLSQKQHNTLEYGGVLSPTFLNVQEWQHFKVLKKGNTISVTRFDENENKRVIIWAKDNQIAINTTHMFIHSKEVKGHWKFHKLHYMYTESQMNMEQIGPNIVVKNGTICVSMFISMCQSCNLTLSLRNNSDNRIYHPKTYYNEKLRWKEIKYSVSNVADGEFALLISTEVTSSTSDDKFWAIDKIRLCQNREFRMLELNQKAACQLMARGNTVIVDSSNKVEIHNKICSIDAIGKFCVPYSWIFQTCSHRESCPQEIYGHGCQKKYSEKYGYNEACSSCFGDYTGEPVFLVQPPKVTNITYNEATAFVNSFMVRNYVYDDPPENFVFQFKKKDDSNWTYMGSKYKLNESKSEQLKDLEPDTEYFVRSVIITSKDLTYTGGKVPFSKFKTKCERITEEDIMVKPYNTSIYISINRTRGPHCKINRLPTAIIDTKERTFFQNNSIYFDNLIENTNYTITIHAGSECYNLHVLTNEAKNYYSLDLLQFCTQQTSSTIFLILLSISLILVLFLSLTILFLLRYQLKNYFCRKRRNMNIDNSESSRASLLNQRIRVTLNSFQYQRSSHNSIRSGSGSSHYYETPIDIKN